MMNIARLSEFGPRDRQRTCLLLAWQAREYLSDAENSESVGLAFRTGWCGEAAVLLEAGRALLERETAADRLNRDLPSARRNRVEVAIDLMERSLAASKAAIENGRIAARYSIATARKGPVSEWDKHHAPKAISIFKRAAETARQETHRALVELCELFADVMPTEE